MALEPFLFFEQVNKSGREHWFSVHEQVAVGELDAFSFFDVDFDAVLEFHAFKRCAVHDVVRDNNGSVCAHLFAAEVVARIREFDFFLGSFAGRVVAKDAAEDERVVVFRDCRSERVGRFGVEDAGFFKGDCVDAFFARFGKGCEFFVCGFGDEEVIFSDDGADVFVFKDAPRVDARF